MVAMHTRVSCDAAVACALSVMISTSMLFVTCDEAALLAIPVHVTKPAAFHIPFDAVSVSVPALGIVTVGVNINVTAAGVVPATTPPIGTADVQPTALGTVGALVGT